MIIGVEKSGKILVYRQNALQRLLLTLTVTFVTLFTVLAPCTLVAICQPESFTRIYGWMDGRMEL